MDTGVETAQRCSSQQQTSKDLNDKYSSLEYIQDDKDIIQNDCYEYEQKQKNLSVKGRLKNRISFWKEIGCSSFVLDILENGYSIPFVTTPENMTKNNNKSALENSEFVSLAVSDLLNNGCITEVKDKPVVVNPLSVSILRSGKKRLILDLREVNKHIYKQHIKFEDWKIALQYFDKNSFMYKFDLKSGYHHIDINFTYQKYLGFSWNHKYYVFSVLPFGMTSSYVFTKCLRPLVKYWRKNGIRIVLYLDDGWGTNLDFKNCCSDSSFVLQSLNRAGLLVNKEKSVWDPCHHIIWLGLEWDSTGHFIKIPQNRINDLVSFIDNITKQLPFASARSLAKNYR